MRSGPGRGNAGSERRLPSGLRTLSDDRRAKVVLANLGLLPPAAVELERAVEQDQRAGPVTQSARRSRQIDLRLITAHGGAARVDRRLDGRGVIGRTVALCEVRRSLDIDRAVDMTVDVRAFINDGEGRGRTVADFDPVARHQQFARLRVACLIGLYAGGRDDVVAAGIEILLERTGRAGPGPPRAHRPRPGPAGAAWARRVAILAPEKKPVLLGWQSGEGQADNLRRD